MNTVCRSLVLSLYFIIAFAGRSYAVNLIYDLEGDNGTTATDKLTSDGAQNGTVYNNVTLHNTTDPGFGTQTAFFDIPPPLVTAPYSTIEVPDSTFGGNSSATFAGWVNQDITTTDLQRFQIFRSFSENGQCAQ